VGDGIKTRRKVQGARHRERQGAWRKAKDSSKGGALGKSFLKIYLVPCALRLEPLQNNYFNPLIRFKYD
jgi:hypothetical protein